MTSSPGIDTRTVWFHRQYERFQGGHVKHANYFEHIARLPGFERRITFSDVPGDAALHRQRQELWPASAGERASDWQPRARDLLFVAGTDWRYLAARNLENRPNPRLNLIQHVRHAHEGTELYGYLANRAVRICVSAEVAEAITATRRVNGPVFVIPNATDCTPVEPAQMHEDAFGARVEPITIIGYKRPELAHSLSRRLEEDGVAHRLVVGFLDREDFLGLLRRTRVAVCLPRAEEGFYLPALEAMAAGCTVVTLDCIGNRSFCRDGDNCVVAAAEVEPLAEAVTNAATMTTTERAQLLSSAIATVRSHSLDAERQRFHDVLRDIDDLWAGPRAPPNRTGVDNQADAPYRPIVDFVIAGAQKSGTTALAHFLSQHPDIAMAQTEGHVFDASDYSPDWTPAEIDQHYHGRFGPGDGNSLHGESTPVYLFLPDVPGELARYNPDLKVVVALRDPVQRAVSHYVMERARGNERLPLWLALLAEPFRLRRCPDPRGRESAVRRHSYRSRGLYSRQLRNLYVVFPRDRVLVLRTEDLLADHDATLERTFAFLGVRHDVRIPQEIVFAGEPNTRRYRILRALLRVSLVLESVRLRRVLSGA
ncbi:MAG: glycosyltransferase [Gammaproteobacteria bacterium]|nr:glycosyltransferase [Gammaproteobacteria bacterium]